MEAQSASEPNPGILKAKTRQTAETASRKELKNSLTSTALKPVIPDALLHSVRLEPSRNRARYRNHVTATLLHPALDMHDGLPVVLDG